MRNITRHIGKLEIVERLDNSVNGNPRYLLKVDGWTCRTSVDSSHGYEVPNYEGHVVAATIGTHYGKATLDSCRLVGRIS
jgi:hypothetical protein